MLNLNITLSNPWSKQTFKILFCKCIQLTKHKFFEIEAICGSGALFSAYFHITVRTDHAGVTSGLTILGVGGSISIYDNRHWDIDNNRWENYE